MKYYLLLPKREQIIVRYTFHFLQFYNYNFIIKICLRLFINVHKICHVK